MHRFDFMLSGACLQRSMTPQKYLPEIDLYLKVIGNTWWMHSAKSIKMKV